MKDMFEFEGPYRRKRTIEFLNKKISYLNWHLERAHAERQDAGSHHYFEESQDRWIYIFAELTADFRLDFKKHRRICRMARLHNRLLNQWMDVSGIIIN